MKLRDLFAGLAGVEIPPVESPEISDLSYSTADVRRGSLHFCVPGLARDGHDFAGRAVESGAVALVVSRHLDIDVPQVVVRDVRAAMGPVARRFFGAPDRDVDVIGITGTNGKTTVACLVRHILESQGVATGLLGTIESVVAGKVESVERTTPEAVDVYRTLRRMADAGDRCCSMELSSHAGALGRVDGVEFAAAVFTNLTQDHLDFHGTMVSYLEAKRGFFFPQTGAPPRAAVVNIDDPAGRELAEDLTRDIRPPITYSVVDERVDYFADKIVWDCDGSAFDLTVRGSVIDVVKMPLVGAYNVANALAAIAVVSVVSVNPRDAARSLADAPQVPGRMERVDSDSGFRVLVDYAHTPDSLENVLSAVREVTPKGGAVEVVFGCGGDRDRGKRPLMGEIAARLADRVVVTSDNPRSEDAAAIVDQVASGTVAGSADVIKEVDRREAIRLAVGRACPGDTVVVAGKGHEQGQELAGGRKIPFDDRQVVREALAERGTLRG